MKFLPHLDDIRRLAQTGDYNVLPVSCELLSDFTNFIVWLFDRGRGH